MRHGGDDVTDGAKRFNAGWRDRAPLAPRAEPLVPPFLLAAPPLWQSNTGTPTGVTIAD
jgi:hypothetical protein